MKTFARLNGVRGVAILVGVTAYLLMVLIYTLGMYHVDATPDSLAAFMNEVGKAHEHDIGHLRFIYVFYVFGMALPIGLYPAGFWLATWHMAPFFFFLVSAGMVSWLRGHIQEGLPVWFVGTMQLVGGFPLVCYMYHSLPNVYELPMFLIAGFLAMFTYHFLVIVLVGMWLQNLAKGILGFLGIKVEA